MKDIWFSVLIFGVIILGVVYYKYYSVEPTNELYEGLLYGSIGIIGISLIMLLFSMGSSSVPVQPVMGGRRLR